MRLCWLNSGEGFCEKREALRKSDIVVKYDEDGEEWWPSQG